MPLKTLTSQVFLTFFPHPGFFFSCQLFYLSQLIVSLTCARQHDH